MTNLLRCLDQQMRTSLQQMVGRVALTVVLLMWLAFSCAAIPQNPATISRARRPRIGGGCKHVAYLRHACTEVEIQLEVKKTGEATIVGCDGRKLA